MRQIVWQLNSVLIGILVYLSDRIDTLSVEIICCFILVSNRPKSKILHTTYLPVYTNAHFFSEISPLLEISMY